MKSLMKSMLFLAVGFAMATTADAALTPSLTLNFRFDANGGANPTVAGATTVNLAAGSAGQTYLVDVWASIQGDAADQTKTLYGLKNIKYRGFSDIVTGATGAFGTGGTLGYAGSFVGQSGFGGVGTTVPASADTGSTIDGNVVAIVPDGLFDFGKNSLLSNASQSLPSFVSANANGEILIAKFNFTTGTATQNGNVTEFFPTIPNTASAANYTQDGSTSIIGPILAGSPLVFQVASGATTISVSPGADRSVLKGGSVTVSSTLNNTGSVDLAGGDYTFAAADAGGTGITYGAANPSPSSTGIVHATGQSFNFGASTTGATPIGNATITFTGNGTATNKVSNGPQTGTLVLNVGGATADNSNTLGAFGPALTAPVAHGVSYAGLESQVVAVTGTGGSNANNGGLGGNAKILAGINNGANGGGTATVSMQWRTRLQPSEANPGQHPPIPIGVTTGLISDILNLSGLETNGNSTDPFVLQMSYNPALLPKGGSPAIEAGLVTNKLIYLVSPSNNVDGGPYVNTVSMNTANIVTSTLDSRYGYAGSYTAFQADPAGGNGGTPASELGAWGVDTSSGQHQVWAVVNHNSEFAVVPEPSTFILCGLGVLGLVAIRRRAKNA